jgi:class 3 adenylate cyclase
MENRTNKKSFKWCLVEALITPPKCAELIERDKPLQINLVKIFSFLLNKFLLLLNKSEGLHIFINPDVDEVHYIFRKFTENEFPSSSMEYTQVKNMEISKWFENTGSMEVANGKIQPKIKKINGTALKPLLEKLELDISVNDAKKKAFLLPFKSGKINLGVFVIWGERNANKKYKPLEATVLGWISSWYKSLQGLFEREFRADGRTYLPSYYSVGWKRVAVLFADIRNFTPLTEILRNRPSYSGNSSETLGDILNEFCSEMARIIQDKNRGRIDKFLGDGLMAIFGEYDDHPSKLVCNAVYTATEMIKKFKELKDKWQKMAFDEKYSLEFNETVEIDLGIGIDFGKVSFDYRGEDTHREYTPVGDHVNFASRLQDMAAKEDEETGAKRPHIIISRTTFRCSKPWLKYYKKVKLRVKGKSHQYDCYGIEPEDFDIPLYFTSSKHNDWETAWENDEDGPPRIPENS